MNIKQTITTTVLAASLALTAAMPAVAQNTSETGRGSRSPITATDTTRVRGEMERVYLNYGTGDVIGFMRMDMGSRSNAKMMVDMFRSPEFVGSQMDLDIRSGFTVRGMGTCAGVRGVDGRVSMYIVVCQDGNYVNTVMATDKDDALDVMEAVQLDGELVLPRGYTEYED